MKYAIHIGRAYNLATIQTEAKNKIIITEEQFDVIKHFANRELDEELNTTYIINKCRFTVHPHFEEPVKDFR